MKIKLALFLLTFLTGNSVFAQTAPVKMWDKTFGGNDFDGLREIQHTTDGGYILGGESNSALNGDKSQSYTGSTKNYDIWIVKVDSLGNKMWDKVYGGTGSEGTNSILETSDGYLIAGNSDSPISGNKSLASKGQHDIWLIKIDFNGTKLWEKVIGTWDSDGVSVIKRTTDGGYILGGFAMAGINGDKSQPSRGVGDYWIVKLDANGNKQWDKTYGGNRNDILVSIQQTADGGYFVGGYSDSDLSGDKTGAKKGDFDFWVIKLDASGSKQWDKTIGTSGLEYLFAAFQTTAGDYLVGGWSRTGIEFDKSQASNGGQDYWIVKLDANGNKVWDKSIGGSGDELLTDMKEVHNGFILAGSSNSGVGADKSENAIGADDFWLVKTDFNGNKIWDKTIGSYGDEDLSKIQITKDGGCILSGLSSAGIGADKSQGSRGWIDYWIVKIKGNIAVPTGLKADFSLTGNLLQNRPNPFSDNTAIPFNLLKQEQVEIVVHNHLGQQIGSVTRKCNAGDNLIFLAEIADPGIIKPGTYFYQIKAGNFTQTKKMVKVD